MKNLMIIILFIITLVEGIAIIHLYKKPQIVIKAVLEDEIDLPVLPKESLKRID